MFATGEVQNRFNGFAPPVRLAVDAKPLKRPALLLTFTACRTAPLARIDTSAPGWTQRSGQAVWTPARGAGDVVIDLQVWNRTDGECLLDVSKASLSFVLAHVTGDNWRIETASGQRHSARGKPPARVGWLQLARSLSGLPPAAPWQFERHDSGAWRLTNSQTGERFDGSLSP
ncbi:MAG: hypothetical protein HY300_12950 [Verrucomicrobia bacterium]|nr:hypothetical protein [Verrucomicrobiota bacterium]